MPSIYDLPNWLFCFVVVGGFVGFALIGQIFVRRFLPRWYGDRDYNEIVGQYLSAAGVFFGITLGLLSVAAWENFADVDGTVLQEASNLGVLYRTAGNYPEPERTELTQLLREYARHEIDVAWPKQQKGIVPGPGGNALLHRIQQRLAGFEPRTEAQKNVQAEALRQFSNMVEIRRLRLSSVNNALPQLVWVIVIGGSFLNLSLLWLLVVENRRLHDVLTTVLAALLGLLVFLLAVMDQPFRGQSSVGPEAFELIYEQFMQ